MMRGPRNSAFVFVLLACLLVSAFQTSTSYGQLPVLDVVVLRGATVIDGLGNPPLADATVIVEGDRIRSIFSGPDPVYPTDATVIDVSGKFMIPGFVDTHVHWEGWMGEIFVNHGITSVLAQADISKREKALPDRFRMAGPDTKVGVFGDRSLSISILNPPPSGGLSNSVSLMIQAEWLAQ